MKTRVEWKGMRLFRGTAESGHHILMDGPRKFGGQDAGPRPMELFLVGLGGCTAYDVVTILEKKRLNITDLEVELDADRAETHPKIYTDIRIHFRIFGHDIPEKAVKQAIELSETKFCSASAMLKKSAEITISFEINPPKN